MPHHVGNLYCTSSFLDFDIHTVNLALYSDACISLLHSQTENDKISVNQFGGKVDDMFSFGRARASGPGSMFRRCGGWDGVGTRVGPGKLADVTAP